MYVLVQDPARGCHKIHRDDLNHPAETSKNSDICDFSKNSDIGKSIVLNAETYILNDTTQFREDLKVIYVSLRLCVQNRRTKWNFPLNFRTMRKLSELYSGIFQTQSSG